MKYFPSQWQEMSLEREMEARPGMIGLYSVSMREPLKALEQDSADDKICISKDHSGCSMKNGWGGGGGGAGMDKSGNC